MIIYFGTVCTMLNAKEKLVCAERLRLSIRSYVCYSQLNYAHQICVQKAQEEEEEEGQKTQK